MSYFTYYTTMKAEIISDLGSYLSSETKLWVIILFLFILVLGLIICLQWRIIKDRENREAYNNLSAVIDLDVRNFIEENQKDFNKRLDYLKRCMILYRSKE